VEWKTVLVAPKDDWLSPMFKREGNAEGEFLNGFVNSTPRPVATMANFLS